MTQVISPAGFVPDQFALLQSVALADYAGHGALWVTPEDDLAALAAQFGTLRLIVVPFAHFADGRGFSIGQTLREMGYAGHLRARGHILVDQFRAALRCGFDDVEISAAQAARAPEAQWRAASCGQSYQVRIIPRGAPKLRCTMPI